MEYGVCEKCQKTGRAKNLISFKSKLICPHCIPVGFMFYRIIHGERVIRIMDFSEGALIDIPESQVGETSDYIQKYIEFHWERITSKAFEYRG